MLNQTIADILQSPQEQARLASLVKLKLEADQSIILTRSVLEKVKPKPVRKVG